MDNCPVISPGMHINMIREIQHSVLSQVKQSNQMLEKHMTKNIFLILFVLMFLFADRMEGSAERINWSLAPQRASTSVFLLKSMPHPIISLAVILPVTCLPAAVLLHHLAFHQLMRAAAAAQQPIRALTWGLTALLTLPSVLWARTPLHVPSYLAV